MIKHYWISTIRYFKRNAVLAVIDVLGIGFALSVYVLIQLWVNYERSFNSFHKNKDNIFQVSEEYLISGTSSILPLTVGEFLKSQTPEIKRFCRLSWSKNVLLSNENAVQECSFIYADSSFFEMFSFGLDPSSSPLSDPNSIVISREVSNKLFADKNPIGKSVLLYNGGRKEHLTITGVFSDIPSNSSLKFDAIRPMLHHLNKNPGAATGWYSRSNRLFIEIYNREDLGDIGIKMNKIYDLDGNHRPEGLSGLHFTPLRDVYLEKIDGGYNHIKFTTLLTLSQTVAVIVLIIALFNHLNLYLTGWGSIIRRSKIKLQLGANLTQILSEILMSTFLIFVLSCSVSILLTFLVQSAQLFSSHAPTISMVNWSVIASLLVAIVSTLFKGSSLVFLSNRLLGSTFFQRMSASLILFQYCVSLSFLIFIIHVQRQISYLMNMDLGVDVTNVIKLKAQPYEGKLFQNFVHELENIPGVLAVSTASSSPNLVYNYGRGLKCSGLKENLDLQFSVLDTDNKFCQMYSPTIVTGKCTQNGIHKPLLINESLAKSLTIENPIGHTLRFWGMTGTIIGVVKDFRQHGVKRETTNLVIGNIQNNIKTITLRYNGSSQPISSHLASIHNRYSTWPLTFTFLENAVTDELKNETDLMSGSYWILLVVAVLTFSGVFTISLRTLSERTKEIAIRRINGSSTVGLWMNLLKTYSLNTIIAFVIGTPITFWAIKKWLEIYPYKIKIDWLIFLSAGLGILLLTWITVSFHVFQSAKADPVKSLRYE